MTQLRQFSNETLQEFSRHYEIEKVIIHETLENKYHLDDEVVEQLDRDIQIIEEKCFLVDKELRRRGEALHDLKK